MLLLLGGRRSKVCLDAEQAGISLRCVGASCILPLVPCSPNEFTKGGGVLRTILKG